MKESLATKLQEMLHYHGSEEFYESLAEAGYRASDDTEDINTKISEIHREYAQSVRLQVELQKVHAS